MGLSLRVIPCLDIKDGRVVKGIRFKDLQDIADPVELAIFYESEGADEITFLDVSASIEGRAATLGVVTRTASSIFIPLTVGGGIKSVEDVGTYLLAGADKVSIGSAAIENPGLINEIAEKYGDQIVVISLDIVNDDSSLSGYSLTTHGGTRATNLDAITWIIENQERGIGELLVNSVDADGTKEGFNVELIQAIRRVSSLPIIASGGAGKAGDFIAGAKAGSNAVLAASVFHNGEVRIRDVKNALYESGIGVRR